MNNRRLPSSQKFLAICGLLLFLHSPLPLMAQPTPAALAAFNSYTNVVASRLAQQHRSPNSFLAPADFASESAAKRLRGGDLIIQRVQERLSPTTANLPGALLHHWRGTAFAPGATPADFERLLRDFNAYPKYFAPQVLEARVIAHSGDTMQASMRIRQHHVITIVMDATYDITFGRLDAQRGYSISRSTRFAEIDSPGTPAERTLSASDEHGFLWRLNTYWSYEQRDGGLYLQIEALSLTRSIPRGLGWAIGPYIESIPRESLEFTLRSTCNALHKP